MSALKYQKQRANQILGQKYDANQQFLTFRNNPYQQNTGRSVYSQQFDYKSLQKYKKEQDDLQFHTNARRNMKNMRSQDKYRQLKEQASISQKIDENNNESMSSLDHQITRNNELKIKYAKLLKLIKKQQKISENVSQQIKEVKEQLAYNIQKLQKNNSNIDELQQIQKQNHINCMQILKRQEMIKQRQEQFHSKIQYLNASINELKMMKKNDINNLNNYPKKIIPGIKELQNYRDETKKQIQNRMASIQNIKKYIQSVQIMDISIRYGQAL